MQKDPYRLYNSVAFRRTMLYKPKLGRTPTMKRNLLTGLTVVAMCFAFAACKKKPVAAKATPPPPAAQPSAPAPAPREAAAQRPVTVTQNPQTPQARMPDTATRARIQELLDRIQDAYFDYDQKTLRPDAETCLLYTSDAADE